jgi:hypothetical protein
MHGARGASLPRYVLTGETICVTHMPPPTINSFLGAPEVTEGQHHLYVINASDPNETTLNYGLSKASGTADVAITPLGTNGHFDVHFQTPGNVVLQASVNDGVNAPVTALKSVTVNPANTAPQVSVTGVDNDATYEFGSVPNATCNVTDAEDGDRTFDATLSSISGPLSADGLGPQTASCSYTDQGGLEANASKTYSIVDTTMPVIVYKNAATDPNGNG